MLQLISLQPLRLDLGFFCYFYGLAQTQQVLFITQIDSLSLIYTPA